VPYRVLRAQRHFGRQARENKQDMPGPWLTPRANLVFGEAVGLGMGLEARGRDPFL
jgi:hypothetical protein